MMMLETDGKEYIGYGGGDESQVITGQYFWKKFQQKRRDLGITARLMFHESLREWGEELDSHSESEVRFTHKDFEELTETVICGNRVGIIIWLEKPFGFLEISITIFQ